MKSVRIVITGAPASGKTEFFERLKADRRFDDLVFFDELARRLLMEDPTLRRDRDRFHQTIYRAQLDQESALKPDRSFITDRGSLDACAFHPELLDELGTTIEAEYSRYSHVILLRSAATLGPSYYRPDAVRTESIEDVKIIEEATRQIWSGHPRLYQINAATNIEEKYDRFLRRIVQITERQS